MTKKFDVLIESQPQPAEMALVIKGLTAFNAAHSGGDTPNFMAQEHLA